MAVPGQTSYVTLLVSSCWTIFMLLVMIGGHLLMLLWAWEVFFQNAGLDELVAFVHVPKEVLLGLMAMAIVSDVWAHFGAKKSLEESIQRSRRKGK